jgi:type IV pilus assembly protein PilQ
LGDVPVVGWLFKNNVKTDDKSELLIFITPKIMNDEMNLR